MSEDSKTTDEMPSSEWVMPEPVFRSSPGQTPRSMHETEIADEVPTIDPGFRDADTLETEGLEPEVEDSVDPGFRDAPTIETKGLSTPDTVKVKAAEPKKTKKSGCFRSFLSIVLLITVIVLGVIAAVVYWLFYYRPADVTFQ